MPYLASLLNCSYCLRITSGDNIHTFLLLQHNNHHYNLSIITNMLQLPGISVEVITVVCILAILLSNLQELWKIGQTQQYSSTKESKVVFICLSVENVTSACTDMHNYHTKTFLKLVKKTWIMNQLARELLLKWLFT